MFASYFKFGISIVEIKIKDCFQITCFKAKKNIVVEKNLCNDKSLQKKCISVYQKKLKTFIKACCTNNIRTGVKVFAAAILSKVFGQSKNS